MSKFKVGDKVRIDLSDKCGAHRLGPTVGMMKLDGKSCIVKSISMIRGINRVCLDGGSFYGWHEDWLVKVED